MIRRHPFRAAAMLAVALAAVCVTKTFFEMPLLWKAVFVNALMVGGAIGVAYGIHRHRPPGALWRILLVCAGVNAVSTAVWWAPVFAGGAPLSTPSVADIGWLAGYALLAAAVVVALSRRESALVVGLDLVSLALGAGLLIAVFLVAPVLSGTVTPTGILGTQLAYVAIGIVVFAAAARLLLAPRPRPAAGSLLAASALAVVFSALAWNSLTLSGSYFPGAWADLGWELAPLLLALAALHPSMRRLAERRTQRRVELTPLGAVLLGGALLVVPALLGVNAVTGIAPQLHETRALAVAVTLGGVLLAGMVVARMQLLLGHARGLAEALSLALDERDRELSLSEARFRRLVERLPGIVYELERHDDAPASANVVYTSPQAGPLIGVPAEDCLGPAARLLELVHPDDRAEAWDALAGRADGRGESAEFRFARPDGVEVWLRAETAGPVDDAGVVQGFVSDISETKRAQAERDRMELDLRLAQKLEAVGQLAAGIAHEINTPVQFIGDTIRFLDEAFVDLLRLTTAYGELHEAAQRDGFRPPLLERTRTAEEAADLEYLRERVPAALERGVDGVRRVARIVGAMRDFAHPPTVERMPADLNRAIETTLVVANNAYKYVADVETDLDDLPPVVCNLGDMNQVFLNLIVNAAHAIEEKGEGERGLIAVRTRVDGDAVVVSVSDTGCGIPPEVAARVYDPFYTTKAVGRGTGQGLAIARAIVVERHRGEITFDTETGRGSTFHVRLPLALVGADLPAPAVAGARA